MSKKKMERWVERLRRIWRGKSHSREQLIGSLRDAHNKGILDTDALAMMEGALSVSEQNVRDIMIPRAKMVVVRRDAPIKDILKVIVERGHSRFPVVTDDKDKVSGILLAKDLLQFYADEGSRFSIREYLRPVAYIPESKRLNTLLAEFRASRNHMAIVVDEYASVSGLVTIEDVLEQIVGDIDDEHDIDLGDNIFKRDEGLYVLRALTKIDEFNEYFSAALPDEGFETVAGMIMGKLGHMPRRLEEITVQNFHFKVLRADSRRIYMLQLQVTKSGENTA